MEETIRASRQAFAMAGIRNASEEIDLAEVHDCFTITEMAVYEDLGLCPRGKAREFIDDGAFELNGRLAINTDGGLKCFGHPLGATGLRMVYEIYKQMQGRAGPRQRKNPRLGLTHNHRDESGERRRQRHDSRAEGLIPSCKPPPFLLNHVGRGFSPDALLKLNERREVSG